MELLHFLSTWNRIFYIASIVFTLSLRSYASASVEDEFVEQLGNDPNNTRKWPAVKQYFEEKDHLKLKKFCVCAHKKLPGFTNFNFDIESPTFKKVILKFKNAKYVPMRIEILGYGIHLKTVAKHIIKSMNLNENLRWYITQGLKKDCVYYLSLPDPSVMEFYLEKHVCGIRSKY